MIIYIQIKFTLLMENAQRTPEWRKITLKIRCAPYGHMCPPPQSKVWTQKTSIIDITTIAFNVSSMTESKKENITQLFFTSFYMAIFAASKGAKKLTQGPYNFQLSRELNVHHNHAFTFSRRCEKIFLDLLNFTLP